MCSNRNWREGRWSELVLEQSFFVRFCGWGHWDVTCLGSSKSWVFCFCGNFVFYSIGSSAFVYEMLIKILKYYYCVRKCSVRKCASLFTKQIVLRLLLTSDPPKGCKKQWSLMLFILLDQKQKMPLHKMKRSAFSWKELPYECYRHLWEITVEDKDLFEFI